MESRLGSERPDVASLDPDPQSHLVLSRASTRQQIGHYLRGPHPAGSRLQHRPVLSTAPSSISLRIPGMPQDLQHDATHRTVLRQSWADVRPCEQGLLLDLKWTKTLQTQHGVTTIPLSSLLDQRICPVAAWNLYRHMLPGVNPSRTTPLLLTTAPPIGKTISASTLRAMFHRATLAAGLSDKNYTPHSLRRGGASFCFQAP